ncbi:MAG: pyruvate, phosphate dikinase [Planctomycetaceae bacterium]|nr:pyruvate, phosphate dikinase [Planctomycetaceae bacterium]
MTGAVLLDGNTGLGRETLGNKAYGIDRMVRLGLPVPPAFVVTTQVRSVDAVWQRVVALVHELEELTGRTFGSDPNPLLLAVRSGAALSMPGMMDTILNVGITSEVEDALSDASPDFAADVVRRFNVQFHKSTGQPAPSDPWEQLRMSVDAVVGSWSSARAVDYRRRRGLTDLAGTSVTIQSMVFGNRGARSGTGVLFTRNPLDGGPQLYGEWLGNAQGEDVVSGSRSARPLEELRRELPVVYEQLSGASRTLEADRKEVQDIEFTVESGELWLLQTRTAKISPEAAVRHAVGLANDGIISTATAVARVTADQIAAVRKPWLETTGAAILASGTPASPGFGVGVAVSQTVEAEQPIAGTSAGFVLTRPTTDPNDVHMMSMSNGVVTEHGGSTSHAAVVCREMSVPCVVGCGEGTVDALSGRMVTVDGYSGIIYEGSLPIRPAVDDDDPDLIALRSWASSSPVVK